jgi:hypothetical protein
MTSIQQTRSGFRRIAPAMAAVIVCALSGLVAASGILVTAGGMDQRYYHWVTVQYFREIFPRIDVVNVATATAPFYHLIVAAISGPLHLTEPGTQFVASLFAAGLAAVAVWFAMSITSSLLRLLALAPLLLSPYFWQSALWMLNDAAALLFGFSAMILVLRQRPGNILSQVGIGLLLAGAVATRQTYIWAVVPVVAVTWFSMRGSTTAAKCRAAIRVALPSLIVLAVLIALWQGFIPPGFREMNASNRSPVSLSYCFAVAAMFFVPVLIAVGVRATPKPLIPIGLGLLAALPALVFSSAVTTPPDNSRYGGLIWVLVGHTPTLAGRSVLLAVLAFVGAWSVCYVLANLDQATALLVGSALIALAVTQSAGGQLFQKYFELPIAALTLVTLTALGARGLINRRWPLVGLALLQAMLTSGIVIKPFVAAL